MEFVKTYGLLAVFMGTFAEGETILFTAGLLAANGALPIWGVIMCAAGGAFAGHLFWFFMGRQVGAATLRFLRVPDGKVRQVDGLVTRHPVLAIVLLQYLYGLRLAGATILGVTRLPFVRFTLIEIPNCLVWAALVAGTGYVLGEAAMVWLPGWARWVGVGITALVLFFVIRALSRRVERTL